jgi:hypothetical protein
MGTGSGVSGVMDVRMGSKLSFHLWRGFGWVLIDVIERRSRLRNGLTG